MEEQDIKEAKRARNFIWMAACDYDIEPLFLAFAPDGSADIDVYAAAKGCRTAHNAATVQCESAIIRRDI